MGIENMAWAVSLFNPCYMLTCSVPGRDLSSWECMAMSTLCKPCRLDCHLQPARTKVCIISACKGNML